jgi:hypothetical protein
MALQLFSGPLTNAFQPSLPSMVRGDRLVLDFRLTVANTLSPPGTAAVIQWYPEFTWTDPNAASSLWFRETTEENLGAGDVRMSQSVRRFSANANQTNLPPGTYLQDVQFKREHAFFRIQLAVAAGGADTCSATVWDPFGVQLVSAP